MDCDKNQVIRKILDQFIFIIFIQCFYLIAIFVGFRSLYVLGSYSLISIAACLWGLLRIKKLL